jgi:hypothetical protein
MQVNVLSPGTLNLVVSSVRPLPWMAHNTTSEHVQVYVYETTQKMLPGLDGRSMVAIFPESAFSLFSLVVFLACPAR